MDNHRNQFSFATSFFCFIFCFLSLSNIALASEEYFTTIILINQEAELVDLTEDGIILKRHKKIPNYFSSSISHESMLQLNIASRELSYQDQHFLPGSSDLANECLQHLMVEHTNNTEEQEYKGALSLTSRHNLKQSSENEMIRFEPPLVCNTKRGIAKLALRNSLLHLHPLFAERQQNLKLRRSFSDDIINGKRPLRQEEV